MIDEAALIIQPFLILKTPQCLLDSGEFYILAGGNSAIEKYIHITKWRPKELQRLKKNFESKFK